MAAEKAGKVKDPEVRLAGCLRAILTTTRPEREFPRRFEVPGKCRTRTDTEFLGTLAEREKQQMVLGEFLSPPGPKLFLASTPSGMSAFPMGFTDKHVTKKGTQKFSGPWQREQQQMVLESFCEPLFVPGKCRTRTDTEFLGTLAEREKQQMVLGEFLCWTCLCGRVLSSRCRELSGLNGWEFVFFSLGNWK
ncbi:hypothetical protein DUI87_31031 [Hirundo rustica rustica]|uniref:Uncharacterized protein n=1 Tax=Hirundo rustica rustica TaxID=333673 RepID=A0A3M0IT20_HIRRU|nr:hypothetical protein DUI87_31031 [Hirundo rustica rustica]